MYSVPAALPPAQVLAALAVASEAGHDVGCLYVPLLARSPLNAHEWAEVPCPCAGLGAALPAVVERSVDEAALLVQRLPPADRERLRCAALCLHRTQRALSAPLPTPLAWRLLALSAAEPELQAAGQPLLLPLLPLPAPQAAALAHPQPKAHTGLIRTVLNSVRTLARLLFRRLPS